MKIVTAISIVTSTAILALGIQYQVNSVVHELDLTLGRWAPRPSSRVVIYPGGIIKNCEFVDVPIIITNSHEALTNPIIISSNYFRSTHDPSNPRRIRKVKNMTIHQ